MPKYTNPTNKFQGTNFLQIPPDSTNYESVYYVDPTNQHFTTHDGPPFYNPVKFSRIITFVGKSDTTVDFPYSMIGMDYNIMITTQCSSSLYNAIEIFFNDANNLPSLPLNSSEINIMMYNRIKRLIVKSVDDNNVSGAILILITDKYIPSSTVLIDSRQPMAF